ncbi:hypothetical protein DFH01_03540 [Falsiroseomonas bella]|uniref:Methyltransferase domain-containing protein n=1 Tax=Falsiroseomonas bella TaxID=2184016 RepID=A0A317FIE0_9PROT|nr:class I SAM-dependent methyltransferase [Falsiroseomonas bella]PWS38373.1 hypothetical protein DFH01_03540 [Falsiroseomonas bella]
MSFDNFLSLLRQKWGEVPAGSDMDGRYFSAQLLAKDDATLLAEWQALSDRGKELRGWWWRLYAPLLEGRRVLEIGSGLGFDAMHFAGAGARWTCCDIVDTNLGVIGRVAGMKGLDIGRHLIDSLASFDALPDGFDAIWCNGSLINLPYEAAREECAAILRHLRPGGRWIELAYPRERWVREGSPRFEDWGAMTDGPGTPWMEWYDMEKLRQRLAPHRMLPILEYRFSSDNYVWLDLQHDGVGGIDDQALRPALASPVAIETPPLLWNHAWDHPIGRGDLGARITVEITCVVRNGTPGLALMQDGRFVSREAAIEARSGTQLIHLTTTEFGPETRLVVRNASALGPSRLEILSVNLRRAL